MSAVDLTRFNAMRFARYIGFEFVEAVDGASRVQLTVIDDHANAQGIGHGGIIPILVDAAGTLAIVSTFDEPEDVRVLTVDLRVNLIGAARLRSTLTARGDVVHVGRGTSFSRVEVVDDDGETIGLGQLTCVARSGGAAQTPSAAG